MSFRRIHIGGRRHRPRRKCDGLVEFVARSVVYDDLHLCVVGRVVKAGRGVILAHPGGNLGSNRRRARFRRRPGSVALGEARAKV